MKIIRFAVDGSVRTGLLLENTIEEITGEFVEFIRGGFKHTGEKFDMNEVTLLAPCEPSKVICVGLNYRSHAEEVGMEIPEQPVLFMKPSTSVIGHRQDIIYPPESRRVDYEAELGVVIGRKAYRIDPEAALEYVLGYTCANDVSARDFQRLHIQWTYAKSFDTFCPLGPWIETGITDPESLRVCAYLNGELVQNGSTADHIFGVAEVVSYASFCMTLLPGDVIITGTPSGIGPLHPGDLIEVEISGVGRLSNRVKLLPGR